jgi:hypothetical protein
MDFVEGLPSSSSYNCVLVVVDYFTKYGHFIPLRHPFTAKDVAKNFMLHVYRLHGMPSSIMSDRDRIFTSHLWKELFRLADVQLHKSSSYHPQSDGQTKRLNQTMETFLRCFVNACPSKWVSWLHLAEFTSRKRLKACGAIHFYSRIRLKTACAIFSGGFLRKPPLEIVFLEAVLYENRQ